MAFCAGCGENLDDGDQFCGSCGRSTIVEGSQTTAGQSKSDRSGSSGSGTKVALLVGGLIVIAMLVVGAIAATSSGGSSSLALVFEPGNNGYGDVHFVRPGEPTNRETRALTDVQLGSGFWESSSSTAWARRDRMSFEVNGGRVITYLEDGDDDTIVAVVNGVEVTSVVEDSGWVNVYKTMDGTILVKFIDNEAGRCQIYRIDGNDAAERLGRGDSCDLIQSGVSLIIDSGPRGSDVTIIRSDGTSTEFETDETAASGRVSPDGSLLALEMVDPDSNEDLAVYLYDSSTGQLLNELRARDNADVLVRSMLNTGALITVNEIDGDQVLRWLSAEDSSVVTRGDRVDAVVNPTGDLAFVRASFWDDNTGEYSIWNSTPESLGVEIEIDLNVENAMGWINDTVALIIDPEGAILTLASDGTESDLGEIGDDGGWSWSTLRDGGLTTIQTTSHSTYPEGRDYLTVVPQSSETAENVIDGMSVTVMLTSLDGRYIVLSVLEDADDRRQTLYVYDTEVDDLIELDDSVEFTDVQFVGETIVYAAYDSDGDVETRQASWISRERPEVIYRDAIAILP